MDILDKAKEAVNGARRDDYGTPLQNHSRTAEFWTTFLRKNGLVKPLTAEDVCFLNILQKVSRSMNRITDDGLVDIAGYSVNVELIREERENLI